VTNAAETARAVAQAADNEAPREQRARRAAEIVRGAGGYRWVGIYDVGDEETALIGSAGTAPPTGPRLPISQATVVSGSKALVPILGAESGIVIGTLNAESDSSGTFSDDDVALLEECASMLRPLYD
jgi:putative methionine-R-sulfoxide reductase with GAF domain